MLADDIPKDINEQDAIQYEPYIWRDVEDGILKKFGVKQMQDQLVGVRRVKCLIYTHKGFDSSKQI